MRAQWASELRSSRITLGDYENSDSWTLPTETKVYLTHSTAQESEFLISTMILTWIPSIRTPPKAANRGLEGLAHRIHRLVLLHQALPAVAPAHAGKSSLTLTSHPHPACSPFVSMALPLARGDGLCSQKGTWGKQKSTKVGGRVPPPQIKNWRNSEDSYLRFLICPKEIPESNTQSAPFKDSHPPSANPFSVGGVTDRTTQQCGQLPFLLPASSSSFSISSSSSPYFISLCVMGNQAGKRLIQKLHCSHDVRFI